MIHRMKGSLVERVLLVWPTIAFILISLSWTCAGFGQGEGEKKEAIQKGLKQLQAAQAGNEEELYRMAEATFAEISQKEKTNVLAVLYEGMTKLAHSGWLARNGKFAPANELMQLGIAEMDRAVTLAPDNVSIRVMRGLSYAQFPSFIGKGDLAREDLEKAIRLPDFPRLKVELRAQVYLWLGRLYAAGSKVDQAAQVWHSAVEVDPTGPNARAAEEELKKLSFPSLAVNPQGKPMPDRFPRIGIEVSPIVVSASITIPGAKRPLDRASLPPSFQNLLTKLNQQPGCLGVHVFESLDRPGMLVVLSWWTDKVAVNNWFYSEAHQGIMREYHGTLRSEGSPSTQQVHETPPGEATQVGVELFTTLPGGIRFNGGIGPSAVPGK